MFHFHNYNFRYTYFNLTFQIEIINKINKFIKFIRNAEFTKVHVGAVVSSASYSERLQNIRIKKN